MGLSVISNVASSLGRAASAAAPTATEGLSGDFAALLSGQTLAATMPPLIGATVGAASQTESSGQFVDSSDDKGLGAEGLPLDPSILAAMIGNPALQADNAQGQSVENPLSEDREAGIAGAILSALAGRADQRPDGLNVQSTEKRIPPPTITLPAQDTDRRLTDLTGEAANIAADSKTPGSATGFNIAMTNATLQHEKITPKQAMVSTPLASEAWPKQFSEKIVWLARNDQQSAQINLNPPQLGPIQITLNLNGDQASALFSSPHVEVRQAIEAAMPQLREMLSSAGISLGDANVGANLAQQNQDTPFRAANKNQSGHENAILPANDNAASAGSSQVLQRGRGLVDLFA